MIYSTNPPEPKGETGSASGFFYALIQRHLLVTAAIFCLFPAVFSLAVGTALGMANFTDVGYPDSAILLRVSDFVHSGHIYPDFNVPPYLVTIYGPLTYVLFSIPYRLALALGIAPEVPARLLVVAAYCACIMLVYLISRRLWGSRSIAWLCALFALSPLTLVRAMTSIRGDFFALAFALLSVYLFLVAKGRRLMVAAAVCAGIAPLIKQTFVAAPITLVGWLLYQRRYKEAGLWSACFASVVIGGCAFFLWREPLMLSHLAALRHPVLEYQQALLIIGVAASQPVVPFGIIGVLLVLQDRSPQHLFMLVYNLIAWLVAMLTILQAGGGNNYFWEPLLVSAVLAGPVLFKLESSLSRSQILASAALLVLVVNSFFPTLRKDFLFLKQCRTDARERNLRKARWGAFVSVISGHRLLSTVPAVTVQSSVPEIPDPYLNSSIELRGGWSSKEVVAQLDAGVFDIIVIEWPETGTPGSYRGVPFWTKNISDAVSRNYSLSCVFDGMEMWLPRNRFSPLLSPLSKIGCQSASGQTELPR